MEGVLRGGQATLHHALPLPPDADKHRNKQETNKVEQPTPNHRKFRTELPQYPHDQENLVPVIYGILRRIFWLLKVFGIFGK